ncbi:MAG TPA: DMT family transporter, partial [Stellaceae bacterium]|nr:DMT family transporter [Stellaceae bacterium]
DPRDRAPRVPAGFAALKLALAISALSTTPILFRMSEIGPSATAFFRTLLAVPVFMLWLHLERVRGSEAGLRFSVSWRREGPELLLAAALFGGNILAYAWALRFTSVANASIISNLAPIFVSILSFVLFGERPSRAFIAAMLAAIAGVVLLTTGGTASLSGSLLGDVLAASSALVFGGYLIIVARLRQRLVAATVMIWIGALSSLTPLFSALIGQEPMLARSLPGWGALIALAVVSYAIGQGLLTAALAYVSASFSAVALLSLPAISVVLGWALLGEPITVEQGIGGAVVLTSIYFARRASG